MSDASTPAAAPASASTVPAPSSTINASSSSLAMASSSSRHEQQQHQQQPLPLSRQETTATYVTARDVVTTGPAAGEDSSSSGSRLLALPEHHPLSVTTSATPAPGTSSGATHLQVATKGRPGRSGSTSVAEARKHAFDTHPKDAKEKAKEVGERGASLKAWWKGFAKQPTAAAAAAAGPSSATSPTTSTSATSSAATATTSGPVFGVPLATSLQHASVQISTAGADGALYVWGYVPVVVAKCGLYLKEHATDVSGIFRVSGSTKRMKELQAVFEHELPDKYGKRLDWKKHAYGPHDVATILRRYLTQMPEPIVPCELYHEFRDALDAPADDVVLRYKQLIARMPRANQYLLLYILDLLSVFAKKCEVNLMTASNLAMIFQPGIIAHPSHAMAPQEHARSRQVLEFLIANQDHFTVGSELQAPAPTPSPRPPSPPPLPHADVVPSDSDDEAPAGGYVVREGQFDRRHDELVRAGQKKPARLEGPPGGWLFGDKAPRAEGASKIVAVDNPPRKGVNEGQQQQGGGGLFRRRTAPSRRSEGSRRRGAAEAP